MAGREGRSAERVVLFGPFRLFPAQRLLLEGDRVLRLGGRALDVLIAVTERPGDVVGKDELIARVWPNTVVVEHNLKVQVAALRRALGDGSGGKRYLITVPGRGYSFVAPVNHETVEAMPRPVGPTKQVHNLPAMLTRLIGRTEIVSKLSTQLLHQRFLTIVGPGGIGKTSVALAVAEALLADYEDGVWLADLAPIGDARFVPSALATVLGLEIHSDATLPVLITALRDRRALIVLDNCEHVIDGAALLAAAVLRGAPGVHILATSREPLRLQGEHRCRLSSLESPPVSRSLTAAEAMAFPAVQLFLERAMEGNDEVGLDDADSSVVADICRKLDGIPLAIELAAARAGVLGVRGLASLLEDRFRFLTHGRRCDLARHQTMRATLDWSYGLLSATQQRLLRRLAVFAGSFTLPAASAVGGDACIIGGEIVYHVEVLIEKSLIAADVRGAEPRYRLLETTRAYAFEKLVESGELEGTAQRHAEFIRDLFDRAEPEQGAHPLAEWLAAHRSWIDDVRAALAWAFAPGRSGATAVALAAASAPLWIEMSLWSECRGWMDAAIARLDDAEAGATRQEMILQTALGLSLTYTHGRSSTARAALTRASELADSFQDTDYRRRALLGGALLCVRLADFEGALDLTRRAEAIAEGVADAAAISKVHCLIGLSRYFLGEYAEALPHVRRAYHAITPIGRRTQIARSGMDYSILARCVEAQILWHHGLLDQAAQTACEVLADAREGGHPASLCYAPWSECQISLWRGDMETAERSVTLLKDDTERYGFSTQYAMALGYEGQLSAKRGDTVVGERLVRACLDRLRASQNENLYMIFLNVLASLLLMAGDFDASLAAVDEVLRRTESSRGSWLLPEALRTKGEILLLPDKTDTKAVEECFLRSLDVAARQGALFWELRTATSLARLWRDQGRGSEARELLASVYERFSEGFETADLRAARLLLDELRACKEAAALSAS